MSSGRRYKRSFTAHSEKRAGYCRDKDLPRLTGLWPNEINAADTESRERIVAILRNALRLERQRGKSGHWCYDINRHLALKKALAEELIALKAVTEKKRKLPQSEADKKSNNRKIVQTARDGTDPPTERSQPVLFLALPTASSS